MYGRFDSKLNEDIPQTVLVDDLSEVSRLM